MAKLLFGCFRKRDANDPAVFLTAVIAVLSKYPIEIVRLVCDPNRGLPAKYDWLPTIAEIKAECEAWHAPMRRAAERQAAIAQQFAERDQFEADRSHRPTLAALKAKYGDRWGLNPQPDLIAETKKQSAAHRRRINERNNRDIENEYIAHGEEPHRAGECLISYELAQIIAGERQRTHE